MRRGEIAGLRWGDWNAASHQLSISRTRQALAGRSTEFATKTRTSRRCLELDTHPSFTIHTYQHLLPGMSAEPPTASPT